MKELRGAFKAFRRLRPHRNTSIKTQKPHQKPVNINLLCDSNPQPWPALALLNPKAQTQTLPFHFLQSHDLVQVEFLNKHWAGQELLPHMRNQWKAPPKPVRSASSSAVHAAAASFAACGAIDQRPDGRHESSKDTEDLRRSRRGAWSGGGRRLHAIGQRVFDGRSAKSPESVFQQF